MADIQDRTFQLRYVGARFHGARLPTTVLPDFGAFRDLLVAFAKDRWRRTHADRQRLPKGFDHSISFDLVAIDEGSALPRLDWSRKNAQAVLPGFADELSEIVESSFNDVVFLFSRAKEGKFPEALSSDHIRALNKFGYGLKDAEKIEFVGQNDGAGNVVYLDNIIRKELITRVEETYEILHEGIGKLRGVHEDGTISVYTEEYGEILLKVEPDRIYEEFNGFIGQQVQFDAIIQLDHNNEYRGVVEVLDAEVIDPDVAETVVKCMDRLRELKSLQPGWHDGEGDAPSEDAVRTAKSLISKRSSLAQQFHIFPTPQGGIMIEFEYAGWDYSVEVDQAGDIEFYGIEIEGDKQIEPMFFEALDEGFLFALDAKVLSRKNDA